MNHKLPLIAERKAALETCGYCPKLCRAACPVSEAEPRDSLTPWGKMSLSWFAMRGDVEPDADHAATAWACTGCFGCRERCDHRNAVAETLTLARADYYALGLAPRAASEVVERFDGMRAEASRALAEFSSDPGVRSDAPAALVIGCGYLRHHPSEARAALSVALRIFGTVRLVDGCCGAPLAYAGDRAAADTTRERLQASVAGASHLVVVDPGCAVALRSAGAKTLVEHARERIGLFRRVNRFGNGAFVRYQDPCQLGRGLGVYDAPRALLTRALGRAPDEFFRRREQALCSGAGALLPITMPKASERIATRRLDEHASLGGGTVVTACASSLRRLRGQSVDVVDLMTLLEQSSKSAR